MNTRSKLIAGMLSIGLLATTTLSATAQQRGAGAQRQPMMMRTNAQILMQRSQERLDALSAMPRPFPQNGLMPSTNRFTTGVPPLLFGRALVTGVQRASIGVRTHTGLVGMLKLPASAIRTLRLRSGSLIMISAVKSNPRFIRIQILKSQFFCEPGSMTPRQSCIQTP